MNKIKIIIDTDIGGDPDDMFALIMALFNPTAEVLAIITGDEYKSNYRARLVKKMLYLTNRKDIPIFAGQNLGNSKDFILSSLASKVSPSGIMELNTKMISKIISNNCFSPTEKIKYLCIQAPSNITKIIDDNPKIINKLEITQMGGAFQYRKPRKAEHNFRLDPAAAKKIISNKKINLKLLLSDTAFKPGLTSVSKNDKIYQKLLNSEEPIHRLLKLNCDIFYKKKYPETILSDPMALLSMLVPGLIKYTKKTIKILDNGIIKEKPGGIPIYVSEKKLNYAQFIKLVEQGIFSKRKSSLKI